MPQPNISGKKVLELKVEIYEGAGIVEFSDGNGRISTEIKAALGICSFPQNGDKKRLLKAETKEKALLAVTEWLQAEARMNFPNVF